MSDQPELFDKLPTLTDVMTMRVIDDAYDWCPTCGLELKDGAQVIEVTKFGPSFQWVHLHCAVKDGLIDLVAGNHLAEIVDLLRERMRWLEDNQHAGIPVEVHVALNPAIDATHRACRLLSKHLDDAHVSARRSIALVVIDETADDDVISPAELEERRKYQQKRRDRGES